MQVIKTESVNTNNGWGFGGWSGTLTEYDNGIVIRKGRFSHRHTGTSSANAVFVRIDEEFTIGVKSSIDSLYPITNLGKIKCISVFENKEHYLAIAKDIDEATKYGEQYKLVKKINIV